MNDLLLTLITNTKFTFVLLVAVVLGAPMIILIYFRASRTYDVERRARDQVREREFNQINHSLMLLKNDSERRNTYLEGKLNALKEK